jgi:two-component system chemotaxis response regulator CheY
MTDRIAMWSHEAQSPARTQPRAEEESPLRVLVVDDDAATRDVLTRTISELGYECRGARDGQEAWELLQIIRADVVISDWRMPRMDGLELLERIRRSEGEAPPIYFIFMSDFGDKMHYVRGVEAGADDYHTKPIDLEELRARLVSAERVVRLHRRLEENTRRLRRDSQRSFDQARVDALTEVGNRLKLDEDLALAWAFASRYERKYAAALFDVDWFKQYNDREGHLAGDRLLRRIAHTLRDGLRKVDSIYRYGGEEFLVVFPEQSLDEAAVACERLRDRVESLRIATSAPGGIVTVSAGVATLDRSIDRGVEAWLDRVDKNLYRAKALGRNRVDAGGPAGP